MQTTKKFLLILTSIGVTAVAGLAGAGAVATQAGNIGGLLGGGGAPAQSVDAGHGIGGLLGGGGAPGSDRAGTDVSAASPDAYIGGLLGGGG